MNKIVQPEQFINPFTGKSCNESITEKEAKERGFDDLQFILRYLEDENETFQWYKVDGKDIIVKRQRPHLNYKKPTQLNHERIFEGVEEKKEEKQVTIIPDLVSNNACNLDSEDCISCGS